MAMTPFKTLLRTAARLQKNWSTGTERARDEAADVERIGTHWLRVQQSLGTLFKARNRGLTLVLPSLREELLLWVKAVGDAAEKAQERLEQPLTPRPDIHHLAAELRQLEEEFGQLKIDARERILFVTTGTITLEGVTLGRFAIELHCDRLARRRNEDSFQIVALDPNPAIANDQICHPHVNGTSLCAGNAALPIQRALEYGRLADAFCLVRSVLNHYNSESPYVALDRWEGSECHDCGHVVRDDDRVTCPACDSDYCLDCSHECISCDARFCGECMTECAVCEQICCNECARNCTFSRRACCAGCIQVCSECGSSIARDERDYSTGLCPDCFQPEPAEEASSPSDSAASTALSPETRTQDHEAPPVHSEIES
jgi:hypothetical protein